MGFLLEVAQSHTGRGKHRDVAIGEKADIPRVLENRRDIRSDKELISPNAHNHRRPGTSDNDFLWIPPRDNCQCKNAPQAMQSRTDGLLQSRLQTSVALDQVCDYLAICFARRVISQRLKLAPEIHVIFYYSVVNNSNVAIRTDMRVRVPCRCLAVSCPPRMPDTARPRDRLPLEKFLKIHDLAGGPTDIHAAAVAVHGKSG